MGCKFPEGGSPLYTRVTPGSVSKSQGFGVSSAERLRRELSRTVVYREVCTEGSETAKVGTDTSASSAELFLYTKKSAEVIVVAGNEPQTDTVDGLTR